MKRFKCDYCNHTYKLDIDTTDIPPLVFGESKCRKCGEIAESILKSTTYCTTAPDYKNFKLFK
jgi:hypothetical protein